MVKTACAIILPMESDYKKALSYLQQNKIIIFPTDTVMGIGCSIGSNLAIERLYKIKKWKQSDKQRVKGEVRDAILLFSLSQRQFSFL